MPCLCVVFYDYTASTASPLFPPQHISLLAHYLFCYFTLLVVFCDRYCLDFLFFFWGLSLFKCLSCFTQCQLDQHLVWKDITPSRLYNSVLHWDIIIIPALPVENTAGWQVFGKSFGKQLLLKCQIPISYPPKPLNSLSVSIREECSIPWANYKHFAAEQTTTPSISNIESLEPKGPAVWVCLCCVIEQTATLEIATINTQSRNKNVLSGIT